MSKRSGRGGRGSEAQRVGQAQERVRAASGGEAPAAARSRRVLVAGLAVYLAIMAAMIALDSYTFVLKSAVIPFLLVAALLAGRFAGFVNDWALFLGAVVLFDALRSFGYAAITRFELPMYAVYAIDLERWLLGGTVAPVSVQAWRAELASPLWLDRLAVLLHASHFLVFLLFGFVLWSLRRDAFRTYAAAMTAVLFGALLVQLLVPTIPPWLAGTDFRLLPPLTRIIGSVYNVHLPTLAAMFDINPIAAMPSLHAAMPALCALVAWRYWGRAGAVVGLYAAAVWASAVYLGEHYLVDVLAGGVLAALVYAGVRRWGAPVEAAPQAATLAERLVPRRIAVALALVGASFGLVQLAEAWLAPLPVTAAFVERELVGRSPMAHFVLGRNAFEAGDHAGARVHLTRALAELTHPAEVRATRSYLARLNDGNSAPP